MLIKCPEECNGMAQYINSVLRLSLREAAKRCGCSAPTIGHIYRGERLPPLKSPLWPKIVKGLDLSEENLIILFNKEKKRRAVAKVG